MYLVFNVFITIILIVEFWSYTKRKKGIQVLVGTLEKLKVKDDKEMSFINSVANYSLDSRSQFFFMLMSPYIYYKNIGQKHKVLDIQKDKNFDDFVSAIRLNIFLTSPTMYIITIAIHSIVKILKFGVSRSFLDKESEIDTVMARSY